MNNMDLLIEQMDEDTIAKEELLTRVIRIYGFEHTITETFAWYVQEFDLATCEMIYNWLVA